MKNYLDYSSITYRRFLSLCEGNIIPNIDMIECWIPNLGNKLFEYTKMYLNTYYKDIDIDYLHEIVYGIIKSNKYNKKDIVLCYVDHAFTKIIDIEYIDYQRPIYKLIDKYKYKFEVEVDVCIILENIFYIDIDKYKLLKYITNNKSNTFNLIFFLKSNCNLDELIESELDISNPNKQFIGKPMNNIDFYYLSEDLGYIVDILGLENICINKIVYSTNATFNLLCNHLYMANSYNNISNYYDSKYPYFCNHKQLSNFIRKYIHVVSNKKEAKVIHKVLSKLWNMSNCNKDNYRMLLQYYIDIYYDICSRNSPYIMSLCLYLMYNDILIDENILRIFHYDVDYIYSIFFKENYIATKNLNYIINQIIFEYYDKSIQYNYYVRDNLPYRMFEDEKHLVNSIRPLFYEKFNKLPKIIDLYDLLFAVCEKNYKEDYSQYLVDTFNINNIKHIVHFKSIKLLFIASKYNLTHLSYNTLLYINYAYPVKYIGDFSALESNMVKHIISKGNSISKENIIELLSNLEIVYKCTNVKEGLKRIKETQAETDKNKFEEEYNFKFSDNTCIIKDNPVSLGKYRMYILKPDDLRLFSVGYDTSCCYHYGGAAESSLLYSVYMPNSSVLVIEDDKRNIKAQAWIWLTKKRKTLVLDNIEFANDRDIEDYIDIIMEYVKNSPYENIHMGMGYNQLKNITTKDIKDRDKSFKHIPYKVDGKNFKKICKEKVYLDYKKKDYVILKEKGKCYIKRIYQIYERKSM